MALDYLVQTELGSHLPSKGAEPRGQLRLFSGSNHSAGSSSREWNILTAIVRKLSAVWLNKQKETFGSYFWRYDYAAPSSCRNPTASSWYTPGSGKHILAVDDHNAKSDEERPTILTSPNFIITFYSPP